MARVPVNNRIALIGRTKIRDYQASLFGNGGGNRVTVTSNNAFNFDVNNDFTYVFWFRLKKTSSAVRLISRRSARGYILQVNNNSGILDFFTDHQNEGNANCTFQTNIDDGKWHLVAYILRSGVKEVWVDGVQAANLSGVTDISARSTMAEAGLTLNFGDTGSSVSGWMHHVHCYNAALTQDQLESIYYEDEWPTENLLGKWILDEGYGNPADTSGNGYNASANSMTWTLHTAKKQRRQIQEKTKSIAFDGSVNALVSFGNDDSLQTHTNFSVEIWFKYLGGNNTYDPIFGRGGNQADGTFAINILNSNGQLRILRNGGGIAFDTGLYPNKRQWNHIVLTHNSNNELWVILNDSNIFYSNNFVLAAPLANLNVWAGVWENFTLNRFKGNIASIRFYSEALTIQEMRNLYYGKKPEGVSLAAEWLIEEGAGDVLDTSGNENNGVLSAGATWSNEIPHQFTVRKTI